VDVDWEKALETKARFATKTNANHAFSFMPISQPIFQAFDA
jgi:hypothetical protein